MPCPGPAHRPRTGVSQNKDGSYTGFIKVQLKLVRPVSVPATKRVPSLQAGRQGPRTQGVKRRTSFYLPKGTVKHLHILSHTRASEVIDALLRKFTVVDNPRKFALFERSEKDEQGSSPGQPYPCSGGRAPVVAASPGWWWPRAGDVPRVVVSPRVAASPWQQCSPWRWCPPWQRCPHTGSFPTVAAVSPVAVVSPYWQHPCCSCILLGGSVSYGSSIPTAAMSPMVMPS